MNNEFIKLYTWIFTDLKLKGNEAVLYALLYSLADDQGICKPSNKYLADYFNVDERTVQRWLDSLQKKNHIQRALFEYGYNKSYRIITVVSKLSGCQDCHTNKNNKIDIDNINSNSINNSLMARQECHPKEVLEQIAIYFDEKETEFLLSVTEKEIWEVSRNQFDKHNYIAHRYIQMKNKYFNKAC